MENNTKMTQQKMKKREFRLSSIYSRCLITRNILLPLTAIGKNIQQTIEKNIAFNYEGKCLVEGFIKPNSSKIITYSSGLIERGNSISFEVVFECEVCFPVEGTIIQCVAKNITKAGIKCESFEEVPSPIIVFIARDHHYNNSMLATIQEGDKINVKIIGQRFELNDKYVSIIGELVKQRNDVDINRKERPKPKLVIEY